MFCKIHGCNMITNATCIARIKALDDINKHTRNLSWKENDMLSLFEMCLSCDNKPNTV